MYGADVKTFNYHIGWRSREHRPGRHDSTQRGMGMEFRGHTTLLSYPDPRRIDVRQTMRDPLEQIHVRIFNQKSATPVILLCDMSGSMNFGSSRRKLAIAADIIKSAAKSATNNADPFALIGFDDQVREEWLCPLSFKAHYATRMAERLQDYFPGRVGSQGLKDAVRYLPRSRALIFLVSDFHMPLTELEATLALMLRHHVVPMILWDEAEYNGLPEFGIASVMDPESGTKRTLLLRRKYRDRIIAHFAARRAAINALLLRFDMPPMFIEHGYDADAVTNYFHRYTAV